MADLFCTDFRSLTTNSNLHLLLPTRRYYPCSRIHSYNSRINGMKRRPLHLTLHPKPTPAASSSQDIDIISTHEHSDGSLMFRFGDPREVAKNVGVEETKTVKEEIEKEDEDGVEKVSDGDHEMEGTVQKADTELTGSGLTQTADHINSVVSSSESIIVGQGETDSSEKLLEGSNDTELPISISSEDTDVDSTPVVDIDGSENVEEGLNKGHEDSTPAVAEMENNIRIVEEKETAEVLQDNLESVVNEEDEESIPDVASISDESDEMENITTVVEEKGTAGVLQSSLETVVTADDSSDSEHQIMESEMPNEIIEDGEESVKNELVSPSPQLEPTLNLSEEIENQNLQAGMESLKTEQGCGNDVNDLVVDYGDDNETSETETNLLPKEAGCAVVAEAQASGDGYEIVEYESENNTIELMTVSTQLEAEIDLEGETGAGDVDESRENDGAESLKVPNDMAQSGDLVEASVHEVTELNSAESETESQEILTTNFILSSGAALFPHPSKVLTGGDDAYFIAGQTWLGVADGVEQWSLEGTKGGVYAQELMKTCERLISDSNGHSVNNPLELLSLSIAETESPGSSTVLIAQFDGQALHVANIGDSGFIVLRHGAVYKRSSPMFHEFNFPLQIERGDDPSSLAEIYKVDLEEGDVIITTTDGLLDNLYDQEVSSIVMNSLAADKKTEEIAELLATKAQEIGSSPSGRSPFADDAQAAGYSGHTGGKLDDVAVIVSLVRKQSKTQTL